jgi:hypothetical protein
MSKKPKIKHGYDHDKDKMKITIRGYSLTKITRDEILENLIMQIESSPDRLHANARKSKGKAGGKKSARDQKKKVSKVVDLSF